MDEYIDKNAAVGILEAMSRSADCECIKKRLEKAAKRVSAIPAADVAPVRHGWWLHTDLAYHWTSLDECSVCGYHDEKRRHLGDYSYCPNCGAKMVGGADDETG